MRQDPSLTTFIDELPSLEAAARGTCSLSCRPENTEPDCVTSLGSNHSADGK